jgi:DnaD/phage-associated family protein
MSIIRVRKDARYFTASNEPFVDKRLSWETRGLIGYLLTKPDSWEVRIEDLEKQGPAKLHKLRRMLSEARLRGYMNRIRISKPDGTFDWITEVFESPSQNLSPSASGRFSTSGSSTSGPSTSGKPADIVSTDSISTELRDTRFRTIANELSTLCGGSLNSMTADLINTWMEKHLDSWIIKAIGIAKEKRARSAKYVDEILINWEANGYPKPRNQRVVDRKQQPMQADDENVDYEALREQVKLFEAKRLSESEAR